MVEDPDPLVTFYFMNMDLPPKPVYASTTDRIGDLGAEASLAVVTAHGVADHVRTNVTAVSAAKPDWVVDPDVIICMRGDLLTLLELTMTAVNALDQFLGEPPSRPDPQMVLDEYAPAGGEPAGAVAVP